MSTFRFTDLPLYLVANILGFLKPREIDALAGAHPSLAEVVSQAVCVISDYTRDQESVHRHIRTVYFLDTPLDQIKSGSWYLAIVEIHKMLVWNPCVRNESVDDTEQLQERAKLHQQKILDYLMPVKCITRSIQTHVCVYNLLEDEQNAWYRSNMESAILQSLGRCCRSIQFRSTSGIDQLTVFPFRQGELLEGLTVLPQEPSSLEIRATEPDVGGPVDFLRNRSGYNLPTKLSNMFTSSQNWHNVVKLVVKPTHELSLEGLVLVNLKDLRFDGSCVQLLVILPTLIIKNFEAPMLENLDVFYFTTMVLGDNINVPSLARSRMSLSRDISLAPGAPTTCFQSLRTLQTGYRLLEFLEPVICNLTGLWIAMCPWSDLAAAQRARPFHLPQLESLTVKDLRLALDLEGFCLEETRWSFRGCTKLKSLDIEITATPYPLGVVDPRNHVIVEVAMLDRCHPELEQINIASTAGWPLGRVPFTLQMKCFDLKYLKSLFIEGFTSLEMSHCSFPSLDLFYAYGSGLYRRNRGRASNFRLLNVEEVPVSCIDFYAPDLKKYFVDRLHIPSLDLRYFASLENIIVSDGAVKQLTLPSLPLLQELDVSYNEDIRITVDSPIDHEFALIHEDIPRASIEHIILMTPDLFEKAEESGSIIKAEREYVRVDIVS